MSRKLFGRKRAAPLPIPATDSATLEERLAKLLRLCSEKGFGVHVVDEIDADRLMGRYEDMLCRIAEQADAEEGFEGWVAGLSEELGILDNDQINEFVGRERRSDAERLESLLDALPASVGVERLAKLRATLETGDELGTVSALHDLLLDEGVILTPEMRDELLWLGEANDLAYAGTAWIAILEETNDGADALVTLPQGLLAAKRWKAGDTLVWRIGNNGVVTLSSTFTDEPAHQRLHRDPTLDP